MKPPGRTAIRSNTCADISMSKLLLKLYITGQSNHSGQAVSNLYRICEEEFPGQYEIVVIDVLREPQLAEEDKILVTPTLIKQLPPPLKRLIGDLSDKKQVLLGLNIQSHNSLDFSSQDS